MRVDDMIDYKRQYSEIKDETSSILRVENETYHYVPLHLLEEKGIGKVSTLPFSIKALLESALRQFDGKYITDEHIHLLANWETTQKAGMKFRLNLQELCYKTSPVYPPLSI